MNNGASLEPSWRPWHLLVIVSAVILAYLNTISGQFQLDDYGAIVFNRTVHTWTAWLDDVAGGVRPLLKLTYLLCWTVWPEPQGFHVFNAVIHGANSLLVYGLTLRFLADHTLIPPVRHGGIALGTALLFGLHPMQTEAVTYITGRSASLMAFFYLASLAVYDHATRARQSFPLYVLSPLFFVLAVFTKEVALTLPVALLLWECCRSEGRVRLATVLRHQVVHWSIAVILIVIFTTYTRYTGLITFSFALRTLGQNIATTVNGVATLFAHLVLVNRLNIDPDLPTVSSWSPLLVTEALACAGLVTAAISRLGRNPLFAFAVLWFYLHVVLVYALVPRTDILNERHFYLGVWGLFIAFSTGAVSLCSRVARRPGVALAPLIGLCLMFGAFTVSRNQTYRTEISLWEDTVKKSPRKARPANNLGYAYYIAGRNDEARRAFERALQLDPDFARARNNMALLPGR